MGQQLIVRRRDPFHWVEQPQAPIFQLLAQHRILIPKQTKVIWRQGPQGRIGGYVKKQLAVGI